MRGIYGLTMMALLGGICVEITDASAISIPPFRPRKTKLSPSGSSISWSDNAKAYRGWIGQKLRFSCPGGGRIYQVWGTGIHTDDSSICTAAVHAGVITISAGGVITIEILPGMSFYNGSSQNGVTSSPWRWWHGSFTVLKGSVRAPARRQSKISRPRVIRWNDNATSYRGQNGSRLSFTCPPSGLQGSVWGTGDYTDDSSICTAAVHAGVITSSTGGTVTIEIQPGMPSYTGSARNGVVSRPWGRWHGSFAVTSGSHGAVVRGTRRKPSGPLSIRWSDNAVSYRGQNGQTIRFFCPAGGQPYKVWGTVFYTDDSSICTAAVHAGLITASKGGNVTIVMRAGLSSYRGSLSNGVSSEAWGVWHGSFVFSVSVPRPGKKPLRLKKGKPKPLVLVPHAVGSVWAL